MTAHAEAIRLMHANVGQDLALGLLSPRRFATALRRCTTALHRATAPRRHTLGAQPRGRRPRTRSTAAARDPADPDPPPPGVKQRRPELGGPGDALLTVRDGKKWSRRG